MVDDVQPLEPPTVLLDTARQVVPDWLRRIMASATHGTGVETSDDAEQFELMIDRVANELLDRLEQLLQTDVDMQRTTPLTLFREATRQPTAWLRSHGVRAPARPSDALNPDDVYGLEPATWSDIDPALHEPGLTWGAWKAATVLARRRDEGLR